MSNADVVIALAGQPNCGKSTVFNALTGARQHIANWPGVTVDRKSGWFNADGRRVEVVDLPGTYSLTSQSPEERVARDFLSSRRAAFVLNVIDASNLRQGLTLTLQLLEMGVNLIIHLNMMDKARNRGLAVDSAELAKRIGAPVVATSMKKRGERKRLFQALVPLILAPQSSIPPEIDYGEMESFLRHIEEKIAVFALLQTATPTRWMALKLMEGDAHLEGVLKKISPEAKNTIDVILEIRTAFEKQTGLAPAVHIALCRKSVADGIAAQCLAVIAQNQPSPSERIDRIVCHRFFGPVILAAVLYLLYYLSIVCGYKLTEFTWPWLAALRNLAEAALPASGFTQIPVVTALALWMIDSVNALLNYIPIFFILFSLIAVLEDSGYMPRMAFIMDRVLRRFGLHGQSILPMVLGGVYVGGCAVPAVMSCKGIPDERSRMATILTIPLLNCMAKVPLYILLIGAYFASYKGFAMFFISTVSLLVVLPVAKILTLTALKSRQTSPFIMEMPDYSIPALRNVIGRAAERVWLYLKKITTVVAAVAAILFVGLQYPGLSAERQDAFEKEKTKRLDQFRQTLAGGPFGHLQSEENIMNLTAYWNYYKKARMAARGDRQIATVSARFERRNPQFYAIFKPGADAENAKAARALQRLAKERNGLLADMRRERLEGSFLGRLGKFLEPVTAVAGFDWRTNVALLSALAAKENTVATLGAIYSPDESQDALEERMRKQQGGLTPLHALALMVFMAFYPPCIAAAIAVKAQTDSVKWMLFSIAYPALLGFAGAFLIFSGGGALKLSGIQAMEAFYILALGLTIGAGLIKYKQPVQGYC